MITIRSSFRLFACAIALLFSFLAIDAKVLDPWVQAPDSAYYFSTSRHRSIAEE